MCVTHKNKHSSGCSCPFAFIFGCIESACKVGSPVMCFSSAAYAGIDLQIQQHVCVCVCVQITPIPDTKATHILLILSM